MSGLEQGDGEESEKCRTAALRTTAKGHRQALQVRMLRRCKNLYMAHGQYLRLESSGLVEENFANIRPYWHLESREVHSYRVAEGSSRLAVDEWMNDS